ncbi:MAG: hypothetical protein P8Y28_05705 [Gammaproteobacteria bacterium]
MMKQQKMDSSNRRSGIERREYEVDIGFPFVDTHGHLVVAERRPRVDRRESYSEFQDERGTIEKLSRQIAKQPL